MTPQVAFPWPPTCLSPNARLHRLQKAAAVKSYRAACGWQMKAARVEVQPKHLTIMFRPPDARRRDLDNMLASFKAGLDGIADATSCDDYNWSLTIHRGQPVKGGEVLVWFFA